MNYYNENDRKTAAWLRELIKENLIAPGAVDERSIVDVQPSDLEGYAQCHFFAGIGGWSYALRLAGWPDERPVWTGSCPCQPFSVASLNNGGAQGQRDKERHLWPHFFRLIRERKPVTVFGEQVASAVKWGWWDAAALDFEADAYACAAAIMRGDAIGANHQRKRLYWVANASGAGWQRRKPDNGVPLRTQAPLAINGDPLVRARHALEGDYNDLLSCNGLSITMERDAIKGFGNAIVPQCAATFIQAACESF